MNRIAVVTGASSGFGLLTTIELAKAGYTVAATMRNLDKQTALLEAAAGAGVSDAVHVFALDVTKHDQVQEAVAGILHKLGAIDVLVNNAGYAVGGFTEDVPMEAWYAQMETNFFGLVAVTKAVLPYMRKQQSGRIINVSSVSGRFGIPGYGPYAASKFAVEGFSEALRLEMRAYGVDVVLVEPGSFKTDIWDKGLSSMYAPADSPYAKLSQRLAALSRRTAEAAPDPIAVAGLIARLAAAKRTKLRYVIGPGSSVMLAGRSLLPWRRFEQIVSKLLK